MNKKKLIAIALSAFMLIPANVFAEGALHSTGKNIVPTVSQSKAQVKGEVATDKRDEGSKTTDENKMGVTQKQENGVKKDTKKQEIQAFKTQMKAKHKTMTEIRQQTIELRKKIETKTEQLTSILNDIKAGTKTLPEDKLTELLTKAASLKIDSAAVKSTSGISKVASDLQDKVNKKDFNNALTALDTVIAKLQARLDALTKLNTDLDDALAIASQATTPSATVTPSSTDTTTTTGDQNTEKVTSTDTATN